MDLSELTAKVKKYDAFVNELKYSPIANDELREKYKKALNQYYSLIQTCWDKERIDPQDLIKFEDLERTLKTLHEEARLAPSYQRKS
ncbi:MAG: hypothetical protein D6780_03385 [Candidatus Dadabacteria bacterium]|nr:MAG: hypothetical protein D6780_03385 [Candidatus Dadabacteria bacterium]